MLKDQEIDLSIIIVSWNVCDLLERCLSSIKKYSAAVSYEVIVVDNASADSSVAMVREKFPWVKLLAESDNLGFTRGNNLGLKQSRGRQICFLNPDTELLEDALGPLVNYLESQPEVGVVAPKLLNADRSLQHSIGKFTSLMSLFKEYFGRFKVEHHRFTHPSQITEVESVLGACMVVRGDICRRIGGFDERYFMFNEETDLCLNMRHLAYKTVYFPQVSVVHHGSMSMNLDLESRQRSLHENRKSQYIFLQKHRGFFYAQMAKLIILLAMTSRIILLSIKNVFSQDPVDLQKVKYNRKTVQYLLSH